MKTSNKQKNSGPKIFGIIGDPIGHTLSPAMHNKAFQKLKIPAAYLPFHIKPEELKTFFKKAKQWGLLGFNVTIPHKETCIPFLKKVSAEAKNIGAVNTVILKNGHWQGDNTDGRGYLKSLVLETGIRLLNKRIVILGSGGAARAVLYALAQKRPKHITVVNRTFEKAGPPFGGNEAAYLSLFKAAFDIHQMATAPNSIAPRAGTELFFVANPIS